jgi:hypothetical protein
LALLEGILGDGSCSAAGAPEGASGAGQEGGPAHHVDHAPFDLHAEGLAGYPGGGEPADGPSWLVQGTADAPHDPLPILMAHDVRDIAVTADAVAKVRHANERMLSAQGQGALDLLKNLAARDRVLVLSLMSAPKSSSTTGSSSGETEAQDDRTHSWILDTALIQQQLRASQPPSMTGAMADTILTRRSQGTYAAMMANAVMLGLTESELLNDDLISPFYLNGVAQTAEERLRWARSFFMFVPPDLQPTEKQLTVEHHPCYVSNEHLIQGGVPLDSSGSAHTD